MELVKQLLSRYSEGGELDSTNILQPFLEVIAKGKSKAIQWSEAAYEQKEAYAEVCKDT